jgi:hypothetical protein
MESQTRVVEAVHEDTQECAVLSNAIDTDVANHNMDAPKIG